MATTFHTTQLLIAAARARPVLSFFGLTFILSWGSIVAGLALAPTRVLEISLLAMALAPPVSGLSVTALFEGPSGLRALGRNVMNLGAVFVPESAAALVAPASAVIALLGIGRTDGSFAPRFLIEPNGYWLLALVVPAGILIGALEETGWTGFAARRLLAHRPALPVAVMIGVVHTTWHVFAGAIGEAPIFGALFPVYFSIMWIGGLTVLRVLIVWTYGRTQSLAVAALIHGFYTGSLFALWPVTASAVQIIEWSMLFVGVFFAFTAMLVSGLRARF